ncbi:MAG: sulfatase-like hydrolase/transferase [Bacteroidota bacterium]
MKPILSLSTLLVCLGFFSCTPPTPSLPDRPNILWITSEDMNAFLGAYGDSLAITPHLDQLARTGVRYTHAFATAPVCSPSRSCLITGVYATSLGTQHLRSEVEIPDQIIPFPKYLREAGYYCTNNSKEDYNFRDPDIWDESSKTAHWRNRQADQAFFSVFNITTTHQSQIFGSDSVFHQKYGRLLSDSERCDPSAVKVPPYHFDTPEVRKLWARYYDVVTLMDRQVGELLAQLEADGLTESTIIFYYSDHGTGMPRSKRALYDSGLKVPLIISAPKAWREQLDLPAGSVRDEVVSFADFAPSILHLLGLPIPEYMQGIPFLGPKKQSQPYVFGHSDRVDEAYEISRTVRGKRFRYIRNYLPHLPLIQANFYTDQSEIMQELYREKQTATLSPAQIYMWQKRRTAEELYDTWEDPYETHNLVAEPTHQQTLLNMREAHREWAIKTYDSGLLHEPDMHALADGRTIYEAIRDQTVFSIPDLLDLTDGMLGKEQSEADILAYLTHDHAYLRFWASMLLQIKGWEGSTLRAALQDRLADELPSVQLAAAQALCQQGLCDQSLAVILTHLQSSNQMIRLYAARIFEELGPRASPIFPEVLALVQDKCPQEDWQQYYPLYSCWALEEAMIAAGSYSRQQPKLAY